MNHGSSRRRLHRGFHVDVISHKNVYLAGIQSMVNVQRLATSLGIDISALDPDKAAAKIMRWLKRTLNPK